jgi:hypothetical protein
LAGISGPSPKPRSAGPIASGRGIAYTYRGNTVVALIAEVEVNRDTGGVWVKRFVCAHDCGLAINPLGLRQTVECGMLHGLSRALWEEVQFDTEKVTSVDWASHPSLRHSDTPEAIDIVLVNGDPNPNRPDSAALRRGRDESQARDRGGLERDLRRHRRPLASGALPQGTCAGGAPVGGVVGRPGRHGTGWEAELRRDHPVGVHSVEPPH